MDEMEKYQQRLQAITEKRRLQEEQDRAKRQLEDEKLRLQQLKRKSLRDQWLMEGPLSPDSTGPRSPLWGKHAQQIEANIDKLQSEIVENTHTHTEDSSTSALSHTDHLDDGETASPLPSENSVNGEGKITDSSHNMSLTNGTAQDKKSHSVPLQHVNDVRQGVETLLFLGYTEAEPGQGLCDNDEDVSAVIRAERVIITEEGEEVTEESQDMQAKEEDVEEEEQEEETEEVEEEKEKGQEKKGEEEREEEEKKGVEGEEEETEEVGVEGQEEEREEKREKEEVDEGKEENAADVENLKTSPEVGEVTETEKVLRQNSGEVNTGADSSKEDSKVRIATHMDEETSVNTDTHAVTKPVKDLATKSASNTDLTGDEDPAAETHTHSLTKTPGGVIQTPSDSITLPDLPLNSNGDQRSPSSSPTNVAAQFQEIPLGGAMVEEEPLLVTKVELLTDATNPNQADGAKTKSCQCCSVM